MRCAFLRPLHRLRHRVALRSSSMGQAATDYLLVLALVALAMSLGAQGPVNDLVAAVAEHYRRFTWAISQP